MKLKMNGHERTNLRYVSAAELKRVSDGNSMGYFKSAIDWNDADDPIVVTIVNTTYINQTLTGQQKKDVEVHEQKHFADSKGLAEQMKKEIEAALKAGRDPQLQERVDWYIYENCQKSAAFHRQTTGYSIEICSRPSSERPT